MLGINRCSGLPATVGGPYLSDAYYCNEEYDTLYARQLAELDPGKRAGIVKEMERILYQDNIFVVWGYADQLEAFRNDVIGSMTPDRGGSYDSQDGYWSWWSATPAAAADSGDSGGGRAGLVFGRRRGRGGGVGGCAGVDASPWRCARTTGSSTAWPTSPPHHLVAHPEREVRDQTVTGMPGDRRRW